MTAPMLMGDAPGKVLRGALASFIGLSNRPDQPAYGAGGWDRFLDWCRAMLGADAAFAVDPQGLTIAARGALPAETRAELSARMVLALTDAHRLAREPDEELSLVVRYRGRWLTMMRLHGDPVFQVGLISSRPVHPALIQPDHLLDEGWGELLQWAVAPGAASSGFLVDDMGLIVANLGDLRPLRVQGIGGRLTLVYDQIDRISSLGRSSWIAIHFDQQWLTSARVRVTKHRKLVFGALGDMPLHPARMMDLKRVLRAKLKRNPHAF